MASLAVTSSPPAFDINDVEICVDRVVRREWQYKCFVFDQTRRQGDHDKMQCWMDQVEARHQLVSLPA